MTDFRHAAVVPGDLLEFPLFNLTPPPAGSRAADVQAPATKVPTMTEFNHADAADAIARARCKADPDLDPAAALIAASRELHARAKAEADAALESSVRAFDADRHSREADALARDAVKRHGADYFEALITFSRMLKAQGR